MVVAVVPMWVVEVAAHSVIYMATVRNWLVTTAGAMHMSGVVTSTTMVRGAAIGVFAADIDHVLIDVISMRMMQVTIVQVIDMATVPYRGMAAARPVLVGVAGMVGC